MKIPFDHEPTAEELAQVLASVSIDTKYMGFLRCDPRRKNEGNQQNPRWVSYWQPYFTVDGKVRMAQDEHRENGTPLSITTECKLDGPEVQAVTRLQSDLVGEVTGHASERMDPDARPGSIPRDWTVETAETSSVGRALSFAGYGLLPGSGFASAEDMARAAPAEEKPAPAQPQASAGGLGKCPKCGKALAERKRRDGSGTFVGCTGYPECNYIRREQTAQARSEAQMIDFSTKAPLVERICNIWDVLPDPQNKDGATYAALGPGRCLNSYNKFQAGRKGQQLALRGRTVSETLLDGTGEDLQAYAKELEQRLGATAGREPGSDDDPPEAADPFETADN